MNLFKKAAVFTDLHLGLKSNSQLHNQDCVDFIDWFIANAKKEGCDLILCTGDFHHNRSSLSVTTLNYSIQVLEKLDAAFRRVIFIPGNHDLFYRDTRDLTSLAFAKKFKNIELVNKPLIEGDVTVLPWLVGDEWKSVKKIKSRYVFGHFELPNFFMNAMIRMPDHGEINADNFVNQEFVFSGHFHKRQNDKNVWYLGNCFPHNYADAWDDKRGMTILEWGEQPRFLDWEDCPKFRTLTLSQLLEAPEKYLGPKVYAHVTVDIPINFEEASFIKETLAKEYGVRELSLVEKHEEEALDSTAVDVTFQSVDQIIHDQISGIESDFYDNKLLLDIYGNL